MLPEGSLVGPLIRILAHGSELLNGISKAAQLSKLNTCECPLKYEAITFKER
jgi:hypothetical protein